MRFLSWNGSRHSSFVFKAVREKKWLFYPLAILLHMMINTIAGLYQMGVLSLLICELIVVVYSIVVAVFAFREYKKMTGAPYTPATQS